MLAAPEDEAVNVVVHVAVPRTGPEARLHGVNVPVTPPTVKLTSPVGVVGGPLPPLSVTVAVQVVG